MAIDEILLDLRQRERSVEYSMNNLTDLFSKIETFGYGEERLDETIEAAELVVRRLRELKEFRDIDLTKEETGA